MTQRPYKFLVTAVTQQVDDDGNVTGEATIASDPQGSPFVLFGTDALARWAEAFPTRLADVDSAKTS